MKKFKLKIAIILAFGFLSTCIVSRIPAIAEGEPGQKLIRYVDVKNNKTVSGATILSKLKTKKGDMFSQKVVDEDIKRLYLLGFSAT